MRMKPLSRTLIALLLLVCMLLPLAACGQIDAPGPAPDAHGVPGSAPTSEPTPYEVPDDLPLRISEVMPSNKATIAADGLFSDWVELVNAGTESISLKGVFLCCGTDSYELGEAELGAGEYLLVFCDDSGLSGHAPFSISKEGETLGLRSDRGVMLETFELPACEADRSAVRREDGTIRVTAMATPGYENSAAGFEQRQAALVCGSPLQISEVNVYGVDWVELHNASSGEIELSDYYLSDTAKDFLAYRLPEQTLGSGEYVLITCDKSAAGGSHAPFALNSRREQLYLSRADGTLADYALCEFIPYGASYGRAEGQNGFFYFLSPNPGGANAEGYRRVSEKPVLLTQEGVFNDVESVDIVLEAAGEIRYTTDGSEPTKDSALYTGALNVSSTAVLRAISLEPDCLPSPVLNTSYILNEHHTLPVVSVMMEPYELNSLSGMYNNVDEGLEAAGAAELFEDGGSFSIACGLKLHGDVSKRVSGKRTLKLCFRSRYEGNLNYDLFGNGVTEFDSILLRHPAEDQMSTYLRDILIHDMAMQCFPALPCLDYKFCILYINGEYWGIYGIREAHSADHFANHYGYDPDTVSSWQRLWDKSTIVGEACEFALTNNLVDQDNYDYASQYIDVDSLIGWTILQAWCANYDCNPSNVRYYYSTEDNLMRFALSDLDLGMFTYDLFDVPLYGSVNSGVRNNYDFNVLARKFFANRDYQLRMAQQLSDALHGPMSDENVAAMIEGYRTTLSPEVERDMRRWFPGMSADDAVNSWNILVDRLVNYATGYRGRSWQIIDSFVGHTSPRFTQEEVEYYFGDLYSK